MRKWIAAMTVFLMICSVTSGATAAPNDGAGSRIALNRIDAQRAGLVPRGSLMDGRVSAHVTDTQLATLERSGVAYERIVERTILASAGKGRSVPPSQVPYGVKMVYGNPHLTATGVSGGEGVTVAVLDTGSIDHRDFVRQDGSSIIAGCVDFSQKKSPQVEGSCWDGNGHGTHVTGIVAAAGGSDSKGLFGVAPSARIFSYKVLNDKGVGYADDIAFGIRVATDRGANIISMSFGNTIPSSLELDAIRYAAANGVLVIAAAGNLGPGANSMSYPAAYAEVIAVGALDPTETVAPFSSRGIMEGKAGTIGDNELEVVAPGVDTLSTYKDGRYALMSGTSMAAPHVSGLAAKMWQGGAAKTRERLDRWAQSHDITSAAGSSNAGPGYDIAAGYGLPQANLLTLPGWSD